ncbi:MAG: flippase-like domain-containing protein [Acidobacteria bacterium]|nr:flippase-like domain-containing protein [Acidobacteriota bacterium]
MSKYIKFIVLSLIALLILWYFGKDLDWQEVRSSFRRADAFYLTISVLIICVGYFLRAVRWQVLLRPITPASLKELFATTTVGFAAIFLIGRAGEIIRPMWLPMRDKRVRPSAALVTLGLERIFDLAALVVLFAVNLLWFTPPAGREEDFAYVSLAGYGLLVGVVLGFAALVFYQYKSEPIISFTMRMTDRKFIPDRLRRIILSLLKQLASALEILRDWRETVLVSFWTMALWFAISLPTWFVLLAFDLPFSFSDSLFIMGFAVVSSVVPTPGGAAGAFHTATAASLLFLRPDIRTEDAAAVSIAMHLVYFAPALVFGLYYFVRGDISIERFRNLLSSEHAVEEIESDAPNNGDLLTEEHTN